MEVLIRYRSRPHDAILRYYCNLASLLMARSSSWDGRLMSLIQTRAGEWMLPYTKGSALVAEQYIKNPDNFTMASSYSPSQCKMGCVIPCLLC